MAISLRNDKSTNSEDERINNHKIRALGITPNALSTYLPIVTTHLYIEQLQ